MRAVENVFRSLHKEIDNFCKETSLKCIENCCNCCSKKNIKANTLEFIPLAYHLCKTHKAYSFLEQIEQSPNSEICILLNPFLKEGACSYYPYRGLICRLFGFSASINKINQKNLLTCKIIKEQIIKGLHVRKY